MTNRERVADVIREQSNRNRILGLLEFYVHKPNRSGMAAMADAKYRRECERHDRLRLDLQRDLYQVDKLNDKLQRELRALRRRIAGDA